MVPLMSSHEGGISIEITHEGWYAIKQREKNSGREIDIGLNDGGWGYWFWLWPWHLAVTIYSDGNSQNQ